MMLRGESYNCRDMEIVRYAPNIEPLPYIIGVSQETLDGGLDVNAAMATMGSLRGAALHDVYETTSRMVFMRTGRGMKEYGLYRRGYAQTVHLLERELHARQLPLPLAPSGAQTTRFIMQLMPPMNSGRVEAASPLYDVKLALYEHEHALLETLDEAAHVDPEDSHYGADYLPYYDGAAMAYAAVVRRLEEPETPEWVS